MAECCTDINSVASNEIVTISYLKDILYCATDSNGVSLTSKISGADDYCPTKGEITSMGIIASTKANGNWESNVDGVVIASSVSSNSVVRKSEITGYCTSFVSFIISNSGQSNCGSGGGGPDPDPVCPPNIEYMYDAVTYIDCNVTGSMNVGVNYTALTTSSTCSTSYQTGVSSITVNNLTCNGGSDREVYSYPRIIQYGNCDCPCITYYEYQISVNMPPISNIEKCGGTVDCNVNIEYKCSTASTWSACTSCTVRWESDDSDWISISDASSRNPRFTIAENCTELTRSCTYTWTAYDDESNALESGEFTFTQEAGKCDSETCNPVCTGYMYKMVQASDGPETGRTYYDVVDIDNCVEGHTFLIDVYRKCETPSGSWEWEKITDEVFNDTEDYYVISYVEGDYGSALWPSPTIEGDLDFKIDKNYLETSRSVELTTQLMVNGVAKCSFRVEVNQAAGPCKDGGGSGDGCTEYEYKMVQAGDDPETGRIYYEEVEIADCDASHIFLINVYRKCKTPSGSWENITNDVFNDKKDYYVIKEVEGDYGSKLWASPTVEGDLYFSIDKNKLENSRSVKLTTQLIVNGEAKCTFRVEVNQAAGPCKDPDVPGGCVEITTGITWDDLIIACEAATTVEAQYATWTAYTNCDMAYGEKRTSAVTVNVLANTGDTRVVRDADPKIMQEGGCETECDCNAFILGRTALIFNYDDTQDNYQTVPFTAGTCIQDITVNLTDTENFAYNLNENSIDFWCTNPNNDTDRICTASIVITIEGNRGALVCSTPFMVSLTQRSEHTPPTECTCESADLQWDTTLVHTVPIKGGTVSIPYTIKCGEIEIYRTYGGDDVTWTIDSVGKEIKVTVPFNTGREIYAEVRVKGTSDECIVETPRFSQSNDNCTHRTEYKWEEVLIPCWVEGDYTVNVAYSATTIYSDCSTETVYDISAVTFTGLGVNTLPREIEISEPIAAKQLGDCKNNCTYGITGTSALEFESCPNGVEQYITFNIQRTCNGFTDFLNDYIIEYKTNDTHYTVSLRTSRLEAPKLAVNVSSNYTDEQRLGYVDWYIYTNDADHTLIGGGVTRIGQVPGPCDDPQPGGCTEYEYKIVQFNDNPETGRTTHDEVNIEKCDNGYIFFIDVYRKCKSPLGSWENITDAVYDDENNNYVITEVNGDYGSKLLPSPTEEGNLIFEIDKNQTRNSRSVGLTTQLIVNEVAKCEFSVNVKQAAGPCGFDCFEHTVYNWEKVLIPCWVEGDYTVDVAYSATTTYSDCTKEIVHDISAVTFTGLTVNTSPNDIDISEPIVATQLGNCKDNCTYRVTGTSALEFDSCPKGVEQYITFDVQRNCNGLQDWLKDYSVEFKTNDTHYTVSLKRDLLGGTRLAVNVNFNDTDEARRGFVNWYIYLNDEDHTLIGGGVTNIDQYPGPCDDPDVPGGCTEYEYKIVQAGDDPETGRTTNDEVDLDKCDEGHLFFINVYRRCKSPSGSWENITDTVYNDTNDYYVIKEVEGDYGSKLWPSPTVEGDLEFRIGQNQTENLRSVGLTTELIVNGVSECTYHVDVNQAAGPCCSNLDYYTYIDPNVVHNGLSLDKCSNEDVLIEIKATAQCMSPEGDEVAYDYFYATYEHVSGDSIVTSLDYYLENEYIYGTKKFKLEYSSNETSSQRTEEIRIITRHTNSNTQIDGGNIKITQAAGPCGGQCNCDSFILGETALTFTCDDMESNIESKHQTIPFTAGTCIDSITVRLSDEENFAYRLNESSIDFWCKNPNYERNRTCTVTITTTISGTNGSLVCKNPLIVTLTQEGRCKPVVTCPCENAIVNGVIGGVMKFSSTLQSKEITLISSKDGCSFVIDNVVPSGWGVGDWRVTNLRDVWSVTPLSTTAADTTIVVTYHAKENETESCEISFAALIDGCGKYEFKGNFIDYNGTDSYPAHRVLFDPCDVEPKVVKINATSRCISPIPDRATIPYTEASIMVYGLMYVSGGTIEYDGDMIVGGLQTGFTTTGRQVDTPYFRVKANDVGNGDGTYDLQISVDDINRSTSQFVDLYAITMVCRNVDGTEETVAVGALTVGVDRGPCHECSCDDITDVSDIGGSYTWKCNEKNNIILLRYTADTCVTWYVDNEQGDMSHWNIEFGRGWISAEPLTTNYTTEDYTCSFVIESNPICSGYRFDLTHEGVTCDCSIIELSGDVMTVSDGYMLEWEHNSVASYTIGFAAKDNLSYRTACDFKATDVEFEGIRATITGSATQSGMYASFNWSYDATTNEITLSVHRTVMTDDAVTAFLIYSYKGTKCTKTLHLINMGTTCSCYNSDIDILNEEGKVVFERSPITSKTIQNIISPSMSNCEWVLDDVYCPDLTPLVNGDKTKWIMERIHSYVTNRDAFTLKPASVDSVPTTITVTFHLDSDPDVTCTKDYDVMVRPCNSITYNATADGSVINFSNSCQDEQKISVSVTQTCDSEDAKPYDNFYVEFEHVNGQNIVDYIICDDCIESGRAVGSKRYQVNSFDNCTANYRSENGVLKVYHNDGELIEDISVRITQVAGVCYTCDNYCDCNSVQTSPALGSTMTFECCDGWKKIYITADTCVNLNETTIYPMNEEAVEVNYSGLTAANKHISVRIKEVNTGSTTKSYGPLFFYLTAGVDESSCSLSSDYIILQKAPNCCDCASFNTDPAPDSTITWACDDTSWKTISITANGCTFTEDVNIYTMGDAFEVNYSGLTQPNKHVMVRPASQNGTGSNKTAPLFIYPYCDNDDSGCSEGSTFGLVQTTGLTCQDCDDFTVNSISSTLTPPTTPNQPGTSMHDWTGGNTQIGYYSSASSVSITSISCPTITNITLNPNGNVYGDMPDMSVCGHSGGLWITHDVVINYTVNGGKACSKSFTVYQMQNNQPCCDCSSFSGTFNSRTFNWDEYYNDTPEHNVFQSYEYSKGDCVTLSISVSNDDFGYYDHGNLFNIWPKYANGSESQRSALVTVTPYVNGVACSPRTFYVYQNGKPPCPNYVIKQNGTLTSSGGTVTFTVTEE